MRWFRKGPSIHNPPSLASQADPLSPRPLRKTRSPSSYTTYPPQVDVLPSSNGSNSQQASSKHMDHPPQIILPASSSYPPPSQSWARIRSWLSREYPELGDTLNYGIPQIHLSQIEMQLGFLPSAVRQSYLCVNGQEAESAAGCSEGLFFGLTLLPLEAVLEEWKFWREIIDNDPSTELLHDAMQSIPPGWIRKSYSQRGWIPLIADKAGNFVGIDLNPGDLGSVGQVIVFGRDFDIKVVLWKGAGPGGWATWLASFADELELGEGFEIGASGDASDYSEDDVGYESYFYDGSGQGQGDRSRDAGSGGGLRYTGEHRGWNVLEAWADKSVRKWHEAGVISDASLKSAGVSVKPRPNALRHK